MLSSKNRILLTVLALVGLLPIAVLQTIIDPQRPQFEPGDATAGNAVQHLPFGFALGAMTGFREAVAGLLWIKCDDFFDSGDYAAVLPLIRIITWLDPHQVDVYETGAWHMDYNFTDQDNRSDRRYIPMSIALMNEAIANNPRTIDLYSDLGYTHYVRKMADYPAAIKAFQQGQAMMLKIIQESDADPHNNSLRLEAFAAAACVATVGHGLAHAYAYEGNIPAAEQQFALCIQMHRHNIADKLVGPTTESWSLGNSIHQLQEMQERERWRPAEEKIPCDMGFDAQLIRIAPKVFVVQGTLNTIGAKDNTFDFSTGHAVWQQIPGSRVELRIEDYGYKLPTLSSLNLNDLSLDPNLTILQDSMSVRDGKFQKTIDMSKDPDMYSFNADKYLVTFWFNPSSPESAPINVQDRIGWLGQAMVNTQHPQYVDTSGRIPGTISPPTPGLKLLKKTFVLTRAQLLGTGVQTFE